MSFNATTNNWGFYLVGFLLIALGISFILIPLIGNSGLFAKLNVPWIVLYVYNKGGFYFATSPILIIFSLATLVFLFLKK